MARPCRLDRDLYNGPGSYFVTSCTRERRRAFIEHDFCRSIVDELLATASTFGFAPIAYCLMPDHIHLLASTQRSDAALTAFVSTWKQRTGYAWRKDHAERLWQKGYWDRILRSEDDTLAIARYIVENPVRGGIVAAPKDYAWSGSSIYTMDEILEAAQIDLHSIWR